MAKAVALEVSAIDIANVSKRLDGGNDKMEFMLAGIKKSAAHFRNNLTQVSTCFIMHAAQNMTSKYINALIQVLVEEKRNEDARAIIDWAMPLGFEKVKDIASKKTRLEFVKDKMDALKADIEKDKTQVITTLLSKPYHLSIKKEDVFRDYSLFADLERAIKRAKDMKGNAEARDKAGVKTNVYGIAEAEKFIAQLKGELPAN